MYPYDPEKARAPLEEAGLTDQVSIESACRTCRSTSRSPGSPRPRTLEIGVTVTFRRVEATQTASTFYTDLLGDIVVGTTRPHRPGHVHAALLHRGAALEPGKHTIPAVTEAYQAALECSPRTSSAPLLEDLMRVVVEGAGRHRPGTRG